MMAGTSTGAVEPSPSGGIRLFGAVAVAAIILGILRRPLFGLDTPLWLDEVFTGTIAIRPTFRGLTEDCLRELGGPVFYSVMWAWEKLFGASNLSLRLPALLFGMAAPILVLLKGHPDKLTRLMWAALAALYIPSFFHATDARAYTLLFLLGTAQIILFMRMFSEPSIRTAAFWSAISALFLLTHYHSALVTAVQGLAFLLLQPKQAWKTWPGALLFAPAVLWMAFHLPLLFRFSTSGAAWQKLLVADDILKLPAYLIGVPRLSLVIFEFIVGGILLEAYRRFRGAGGARIERSETVAVAASLIAIAIVISLGFLRPNFVPRYLMPFVPGALLGAAIWTRVLTARFSPLPWLVLAALVFTTLWDIRLRSLTSDWRAGLSWQAASEDLAASGARRLFFSWDNPTAALGEQEMMARVGSFFFRRSGVPIPTRNVTLAGDVDPNMVLPTIARAPGDAFIWVYDHQVDRTRANQYPPALPVTDQSLRCRSYSQAPHGVIACIRR
jgi:hypothetical protein